MIKGIAATWAPRRSQAARRAAHRAGGGGGGGPGGVRSRSNREPSTIGFGDVVDARRTLVADAGYLARLARLPVRLTSLLDTRPMRATLERLLPLDRLHTCVRSGPVDAVAVVTTSVSTGRTVVFVEKKRSVELPADDDDRAIRYVETELNLDHLLASAAVPGAFRPVLVEQPAPWRGWYVDGGLRLNAPLKPALDFGCSRLGVVATQPATAPATSPVAERTPDVQAAAALALRTLLADRMVEDLRVLAKVNDRVTSGTAAPGHRKVTVRFAGPSVGQAGDLGALAAASYRQAYGGLRALRNLPVASVKRLLGGDPADHGELLSYLFFDRAFTGPAAALGARHAAASARAAP